MTRKVLVTGGTGFVGRALVPKLVEGGHRVRVLARGKRKTSPAEKLNLQIVAGDVTKAKTLPKALEDIEVVIHLVGIIAEHGESTFEKVHCQGTANLVEAAKAFGIRRFLHMSALGSRPQALTNYHKTKFRAEQYLHKSGLDFTIFRPSVILGPDSEFLEAFARIIRLSPLVALPKTRRGRLQPIWVGDVADCFVQAIENETTIGQTYELGGPEKLTLKETIERISDHLGKKRPIFAVPMGLMRLGAQLLQTFLPKPPLTREQLLMLEEDNTCDMQQALRLFKIEHISVAEALERSLKSPR